MFLKRHMTKGRTRDGTGDSGVELEDGSNRENRRSRGSREHGQRAQPSLMLRLGDVELGVNGE